jgi:hypothetical protein
MRRLSKTKVLILLVCLIIACAVTPGSENKGKTQPGNKPEQIVVNVRKADKGFLFEVESNEYKKKGDANYVLADLKLQKGGDCQIIALVDDRLPLSTITEISEMAINAGFKDIRPFVSWHNTGRMAQVQFGPAIKFTQDPDKIDKREAAQNKGR